MMDARSRYFKAEGHTLGSVNANEELLASLRRINTFNPPVQTCSTGWTFNGFYAGPTSVAYLFYRLNFTYPELEFKDQSLWDWAEAYLSLSSRVPKPDPNPNDCGIGNETLAYCAMKATMLEDASLARKLCSYQNVINTQTEPGSNEWIYGRAGYLYFLRLVLSVFDPERYPSASELLSDTIQKTVDRIMGTPQPWTWHGKHYLGAAHGDIGILCQVSLSGNNTASLQHTLARLLEQQYSSGNFPSSLPARSDRLVQFCHGGPGFVLALESMLPQFPALEEPIRSAITCARKDILARGLLTKEPSLCHGIAGNALALENHAQMQQFLSQMTSTAMENRGWMQKAGLSDEFVGLYTGEAGRAWAWAVLDQKLPLTCIGFNDL